MSLFSKIFNPLRLSLRYEHKRIMPLIAIDWGTKKAFNDIQFYMCLTGIPIVLFITYCNIFIGQAELADIPEGYVPKEYEYYKSPVSRLFIKYFVNRQRMYEQQLHFIELDLEKVKWSHAWDLFSQLQAKYKDSKMAWYVPGDDKYIKHQIQTDKYLEEQRGNDYGFFL